MWFQLLRYLFFTIPFGSSLSSSSISLLSCVSYRFFTHKYSAGLSTCYPSTTPFGLALGPDLPWADEPSPGNLRFSTGRILTFLSLLIPAFSLLPRPHVLPVMLLPTTECSSTTYTFLYKSAISVYNLAPVIFGATSLDQWAITHSLNEWLLLSQHPGCLCIITSFST